MTTTATEHGIVGALDDCTSELVRLAVTVAIAREAELRAGMMRAAARVPAIWVEELILQSYLFAGFPRALNAAREWRRVSRRPAPATDEATGPAEPGRASRWRARGEATCAEVYGPMYGRLRSNVRELHPALDAWMVDDGHGKVLGRPGLDLARRELCIVATCTALEQERQLHAHLHGALNAGASPEAVGEAVAIGVAAAPAVGPMAERAPALWARVRRKRA